MIPKQLNYIRFWDILQERYPLFSEFEKWGCAILDEEKNVENIWQGLREKKAVPIIVLLVYSSYAEKVLNDQLKAKSIKTYLQEAIPSANKNIVLNHASHGDGVVAVHSRGEMKGYIESANSEFSKISGYSPESLKNLSLTALIPEIFREAHLASFTNSIFCIESGDDIKLDEKRVFMLHKSQYIVPIKMKIVEFPNFANDFNFLAIINLDKERNDSSYLHILLDPNYAVSAISSRINLFKNYLKNNNT